MDEYWEYGWVLRDSLVWMSTERLTSMDEYWESCQSSKEMVMNSSSVTAWKTYLYTSEFSTYSSGKNGDANTWGLPISAEVPRKYFVLSENQANKKYIEWRHKRRKEQSKFDCIYSSSIWYMHSPSLAFQHPSSKLLLRHWRSTCATYLCQSVGRNCFQVPHCQPPV